MSHLDPPSPIDPPAGMAAVCGIVLLTGPSGHRRAALLAQARTDSAAIHRSA